MPKSTTLLIILKYRMKASSYTRIFFYLGVTEEYTETHAHVPFLEGKSSTGRLGIDIHATAGKGDVGFCGNWTLEISVKQPVEDL
jgi:deoxycytidine triphosphate deaminase